MNRKGNGTYLLSFNKDVALKEIKEKFVDTDLFKYVEPNYTVEGGIQTEELKTILNEAYFDWQHRLNNDDSFSLAVANAVADIDMDLVLN